jgi:hypothetical protein
MKDFSKSRIGLFLALAGIGLSALAQHSQSRDQWQTSLLRFDSANGELCAGFDPGHRKLVADQCNSLMNRSGAGLSYRDDLTIRSKLTDECLTRQPAIYTELSFEPCKSGLDFQHFVFGARALGNDVWWSMFIPVTGPRHAVAPTVDTCLVTSWPHPGSTGSPGVYVWSCADWEYTPNKVVHLLSFGLPPMPPGAR